MTNTKSLSKTETPLFFCWYPSPVGNLLIAGNETSLQLISFPAGKGQMKVEPQWLENPALFTEVTRQLDAYFARELQDFDLPLAPHGTPFQQSVWAALQRIPYGETCSYGDIAREIGNPKSVRAVGGANGRNPIPIIIPCHRVIGSNGTLTGFGGGLETKTSLLQLESAQQLTMDLG